MNTAEGVRRLAAIIRWIGDGLGAVCLAVGMVFAYDANANQLGVLVGALLLAALFSGSGRAVSWILRGFAEGE